ncbi:MAG: helix-turn-helix domain-containing protein [Dactylosporangium sp.]|nr:helix-turn-helix domain-containing protein [Dactylosporangium sp.]NNJ60894.1 helix-turn-helix domain-containing protein [Dactylosporangium sp.]
MRQDFDGEGHPGRGGTVSTGSSPTLRRRRLGLALRALREAAGRTGDEAGTAVERSGSWISRIETGRVGLRVRDLRDLYDFYGMTDASRLAELETLARDSTSLMSST